MLLWLYKKQAFPGLSTMRLTAVNLAPVTRNTALWRVSKVTVF